MAKAVHINVGKRLQKKRRSAANIREIIDINNLPREKGLLKAINQKRIPFFSYASEERFHDLFPVLHGDACINGIYLALMVFSTMMTAVGLYLYSALVIE